MVVIRYPAFVDEDAAPAYYRLFARHAIGGRVDSVAQASVAVDRLAQAVLAKSNYFAMSLYRELRDALPPDSVLLSPHLVELGDEGRLTSSDVSNLDTYMAYSTEGWPFHHHLLHFSWQWEDGHSGLSMLDWDPPLGCEFALDSLAPAKPLPIF